MNIKCYVRLNKDWRSQIAAMLLEFVPSSKGIHDRTDFSGNTYDTISTDGIVRLMTFDKGGLYQIPLDCITVVDEWDGRFDVE